ncbi:hypothetical protein [Streptomyces sp. GESEQ-13]|uniref:hypothetical protein n=1 Tax=Streptomyces sp. GESEQ-13 TaxID=2812654 RepID=UPI001FF0D4F7
MPTRTCEPTAVTARALAPDLARGFMLLFIALANSHYFLSGRPVLGGYPRDGSPRARPGLRSVPGSGRHPWSRARTP